MSTFLTTQEMQDLINVDRSTVYRMAEDGRLPGIKVGRQWRFPVHRLADQLGLAHLRAAEQPVQTTTGVVDPSLDQMLSADAVQSVADLLGDLFGAMAIITDMDGRPLTTVANPCGFYRTIAEQPGAVETCLSGWRELADQPHVSARFVTSHLGFLCARSFVWVDRRPVGMLVVGGVTPDIWPPDPLFIRRIADEMGIASARLFDTVEQTYDVDHETQRWILLVLSQVADLVSQLATARHQLRPVQRLSQRPSQRPSQGSNES